MFFSKSYLGPERRSTKPHWLFIALAGFLAAGLVFSTLCPIGLRPHVASPDIERFSAYLVLGAAAALALRRRPLMVIGGVIFLACVLEAGQLLIPTRDARFGDAMVKAAGGLTGSFLVYAFFPLRRLGLRLLGLKTGEKTEDRAGEPHQAL